MTVGGTAIDYTRSDNQRNGEIYVQVPPPEKSAVLERKGESNGVSFGKVLILVLNTDGIHRENCRERV